MRALLAVLILAAPAAAAARPLDADRTFARGGIFRMDEPVASSAVIPLTSGGTLHATNGAGILRLSGRGRREAAAFLQPPGTPAALAPAGRDVIVIGTPAVEYGKPTPLGVWRVDRDGRSLEHHAIALPGGASAHPRRLVRRKGRAFALVDAMHPQSGRRRLVTVALTGAVLDTSWGDGGFLDLGSGDAGIAISGRDAGLLVVARALETRCQRRGYTGRKERSRLRVAGYGADGGRLWTRTTAVGGAGTCPAAEVGDVIHEGARIVVGGAFGRSAMLVSLRRDGTRNMRFGRRGVASMPVEEIWTPPQVARRTGGYAFAYTGGQDGAPFATVGLIDRRGRSVRRRRLKVTRSFPNSAVHDIAIDRRGGIVAAGQLHDTDLYIREDYGQPHLAVWRVRAR